MAVNRKKKFLVALGVCLSLAGTAFGDAVSNLWNSGKSYYLSGSYQASIRSGLDAIGRVYQKQALKVLSLIPDLDGFSNIETNLSYNVSDQNGILDYYLQVQKLMTNTNVSIRVTVDTSLNNLERYVNLIRSYEFLTDKGGYRKLVVKIKKSEWTNITLNTDAYLIPVLSESNDTILSGALFKVSFNYTTDLKQVDKDKLMESRVKEILEKMNVRELANLVK